MKLFKHQMEALQRTSDRNRVAYYHEMGTGKTFTGSEKMRELNAAVNLVVCQKSKVEDWLAHFKEHYPDVILYDLTVAGAITDFLEGQNKVVGVINYDLLFRRTMIQRLRDFTLMLDESSLIQNETTKRTKAILNLQPKNVILLSGTPTGGKYEKLYSQLKLLGWKISKRDYWNQFVEYRLSQYGRMPFPIKEVIGYKNVELLKKQLAAYGADFLKADESDLPSQNFNTTYVAAPEEYKKFMKDSVVEIGEQEFIGDNTLKKLLYARQICGAYCKEKLQAFIDLLDSTEDRLIVFYNFNNELQALMQATIKAGRPISQVNGSTRDMSAYEVHNDSVTFIQYQAGAMGLNLQKAQHIVYFTLPLSSELYEQSKKRIHRLGQQKPCFYHTLMCEGSVEEKIQRTLAMRRDYNEKLFEQEELH